VRRTAAGFLSLAVATGLGVTIAPAGWTAPVAQRAHPVAQQDPPDPVSGDELPNPQEEKRRALRQQAVTTLLNGTGTVQKRGPSTVMKVGETAATDNAAPGNRGRSGARKGAGRTGQYVELAREKTDRIFVVLAEFGTQRHPDYPDQDTDPNTPGPAVFDGPLHNAIPEPDRTKDNTTVWRADYDQGYYGDLYFGTGRRTESVKTYYERQSSGRYSVDGMVTDWVKVGYNEARYGRSNGYPCASNVCSNTWNLVQDAVNQWVADQKAAGRSDAQIRAELATFDEWDRYDHDGDGDFNEPDGYIDHFQVVHSGGDQADGDPQQGEDAIWSHRWYVQLTPIGAGGPAGAPFGGTQIADTGLWVGDYTIQPENGGLSVFVHEYGHDLGLPDLYDTSGGGENSVNWWSLMAQSRLTDPRRDGGIGERAGDLGAWEKLQLGWLNYEIVLAGQNRNLNLGPHEYNSPKAQGAVVVLPKKAKTVELVAPYAGEKSWWSGSGDDLDNTMSRQVSLPAGAATLTMQANWDIEDCGPDPCDYAFVEVDSGAGWQAIAGSITLPAEGNGIDGNSGGWVPATFDLSAYQGQTIGLRLHYQTDGAAGGKGFFADQITLTAGAAPVFTSGAETGDEGWSLDGYSAVGASLTQLYDNYYIASHRDYVSYDQYLKVGPYNFGFLNTRPDWVEHFPYQDGLLISYWDTSTADNNTSQHPGEGEILPIDANPRPIVNLTGAFWRPRVASYDAPFSKERSDSLTLHLNGQRQYIRGQSAKPTFDDSRQFWYAETPTAGVKVPNNGVDISVLDQKGTSMTIRVSARR